MITTLYTIKLASNGKIISCFITILNCRIVANYVLWRFIRHRIINLDRRYPKVMQELYRKLYGIEEKPPRWKFCTNYVRGNLGNALGSLYVKRYFDEHSKEDVRTSTVYL